MTYNGLTYWNAGSIDPVNLRVTGQVLENANGSIYETAQGTTFDASGRLTQRENWTTPNALLNSFHLWPAAVYTYDAEDHLTYQISSGATGSFSNVEYLYWGPAGHALTGGSGSTPTYRAYHWSGSGLLFTSLSSGSVNDYKLGIDGDYLAADALQSGAVYFDRDQRGRAVQSHWSGGYSPVCQAAGEYWQSNVACPYLLGGNSGSGQMPEFFTSGFGPVMTYYRQDGVTDSYLGLQGVRDYDAAVGQWTTPDAYAGDISDPTSQAKCMWNNNNPIAYSDPTGYSTLIWSQWWKWLTNVIDNAEGRGGNQSGGLSDENLSRIKKYDTPGDMPHLAKATEALRGIERQFENSVRKGSGVEDFDNPFRGYLRGQYTYQLERISNASGLSIEEVLKGTGLPRELPGELEIFQMRLQFRPGEVPIPDIEVPPQ